MTELVRKLLSETSLNSFADSTPGRGHLAFVTTSATIGEAIKVFCVVINRWVLSLYLKPANLYLIRSPREYIHLAFCHYPF